MYLKKMPVPKALATLAIPTIISQLISMIYNLADTYYIGQTGNPIKVASVSLVVVLIFLISAMANFFGIGGGSLIARLMGMKKQEEARSVCAVSIYGAVIFTGVFIAFCALFRSEIPYILGLLTAN